MLIVCCVMSYISLMLLICCRCRSTVHFKRAREGLLPKLWECRVRTNSTGICKAKQQDCSGCWSILQLAQSQWNTSLCHLSSETFKLQACPLFNYNFQKSTPEGNSLTGKSAFTQIQHQVDFVLLVQHCRPVLSGISALPLLHCAGMFWSAQL